MPIHAHRWVWICHHGYIPSTLDIHHKDGDKSNNEIDNLEAISRSDHLKKHWEEGHYDLEQRRKQLSEARTWLKTPQGKEKQSKDAKIGWRKRIAVKNICLGCDTEFDTYQKWAKCCSPACYMRWRRKNNIGFVQKKCWICGNFFNIEKTSRIRTCGQSCGGKLAVLTRNSPK